MILILCQDIIPLNTLQFRDNFGYPYKVNSMKELIEEIKINKNPFSCLLSEYDKSNEILKNEVIHLKIYRNVKRK